MVPIQNIRLVRGSSKIWWLQTVSSLVLIAIISIGNSQIPKKKQVYFKRVIGDTTDVEAVAVATQAGVAQRHSVKKVQV